MQPRSAVCLPDVMLHYDVWFTARWRGFVLLSPLYAMSMKLLPAVAEFILALNKALWRGNKNPISSSYYAHFIMRYTHSEQVANGSRSKGKVKTNRCVCVCVSSSRVDEQLSVDIKTKSHCSLLLCLLHNKPLKPPPCWIFPLVCDLEHHDRAPFVQCWLLTLWRGRREHDAGLLSLWRFPFYLFFFHLLVDTELWGDILPGDLWEKQCSAVWILLKFGNYTSHIKTIVCIFSCCKSCILLHSCSVSDIDGYLCWRFDSFFLRSRYLDRRWATFSEAYEKTAKSFLLQTMSPLSPLMAAWNFQLKAKW